jgi:hypothetical protein
MHRDTKAFVFSGERKSNSNTLTFYLQCAHRPHEHEHLRQKVIRVGKLCRLPHMSFQIPTFSMCFQKVLIICLVHFVCCSNTIRTKNDLYVSLLEANAHVECLSSRRFSTPSVQVTSQCCGHNLTKIFQQQSSMIILSDNSIDVNCYILPLFQ